MTTDRGPGKGTVREWHEGRWWAITGVTALLSMVVATMLLFLIAFGVVEGAESVGRLTEILLVSLPFFLAGVLTGAVGGVRSWRLLIPGLAAVVGVHLGALGGGLVGLVLASVASVVASRVILGRSQ